MRILVTGISGEWGRAVVETLVESGHLVTALSASQADAAWMTGLGLTAAPGRLSRADEVIAAAVGQEAVVHCGGEAGAGPEQIVPRLLAAARGCADLRSLIFTSSLYRLSPAACGDVDEANAVAWLARRLADEALILNAASARLNTAVIRPGQVYGGAGGYFVQYFLAARPGGLVTYVGHRQHASTFADRSAVASFYRQLLEDRDYAAVRALDGGAGCAPDLTRVLDELAAKGGATDMAARGWSLSQALAAPAWSAVKPTRSSHHN